MKKRTSKTETNTSTSDGTKIWNQLPIDFTFSELNSAKSIPKTLGKPKKVICSDYVVNVVLFFSSSNATISFTNSKSIW